MHDSFDSCKQRRRVTKMDGQATMIKFFFRFFYSVAARAIGKQLLFIL